MRTLPLLLTLFAMLGLNVACGGGFSKDPFADYDDSIREATVEETKPPVPPGINSNSILITPSKSLLLFEEGTEAAYDVEAKVFIPDAEFDMELVNPPPGMTIEFREETLSDDVLGTTGPVLDEDATADVDAEDGDEVAAPEEPLPSNLNRKVFVIKWKPSYDTIPDDSIGSILRHISVRLTVDEDIAVIREIPYMVIQSERQLKIVSADVPNEFIEGEKTQFKVYVEYPNFIGAKFPTMAVFTKGNSSGVVSDGCANMQNWIKSTAQKIVNDPTSPNNGLIEYTFEANFTKLDITTSRTTCTIEVKVSDTRSVSAPYEIAMRVKNTIKAPKMTWSESMVYEMEQGTQSIIPFFLMGVQDEGTVELSFETPCITLFGGMLDCSCKQEVGVSNRHILNCIIFGNHKVFDRAVDYTLVMKAKVKNLSEESELVTFRRKIRFYPPGSKTNNNIGVGVDEEDGSATTNPAPAPVLDTNDYGGRI